MAILSLAFKVLAGAAIGAALGYFGQCSSGTCPLTATWWRGAIFGGLLGLMFAGSSSGGYNTSDSKEGQSLVKGIASGQFQAEVLDAPGPVLVDFYAPWCGPCRKLAPVLGDLAKEFSTTTFVKVNVDEEPELASRFRVEGVPTLILFNAGKPVDRAVGFLGPTELRARIQKTVAPARPGMSQ